MNITIDTEKKTLLINGDTNAKELAMFICRNNFNEYKVVKEFDNLPDWIKEPLGYEYAVKTYPGTCLFVNTYWIWTTTV